MSAMNTKKNTFHKASYSFINPKKERTDVMKDVVKELQNPLGRRSFLKKGVVAGAATAGIGLLGNSSALFAQNDNAEENSGSLTKGDAAILRFLAAAEIIETDLWQQYNELGGIQDSEVSGGS